jgi:hypothetical protein
MSRKRLIVGQRYQHLPFGTINGTMDDVDRLAAQVGLPPGVAQFANVDGSHVLVCLAKNTSDEGLVERAPAGVVQSAFDLPVLDPDTEGGDVATEVIINGPAIEIEPPASETRYWVITIGPIPAGGTGLVAIMGLIAARVDVTEATHQFATFQAGDAVYLKSAASGVEIWDRKLPDATGKQWALVMLGGGSGSSIDIKIVLIDEDIEGITEDDPATVVTAADFPLTADEISAGMTLVFQDPPDADPTVHVLDSLNLSGYLRKTLTLKYFHAPSKTVLNSGTLQSGSTSTTAKLAVGASTTDDEYNGLKIVVIKAGVRQTRTITDYVGSTLVATVAAWGTTPDNTYTYEVYDPDPGYEENADGTAKAKLELATTTVDIPGAGDDPTTRVVRYATTSVYYDDGTAFKVGKYKRTDYADYPADDVFPPNGSETFQSEGALTDPFFNKRYRGIAINGVLFTRFCKALPPRPFTPN